ncbi:LysR family transcriptional regulator [Ruegeria sp. R13_0]|uniref:LysR family transcriptional regulator n=1 Tax=Ruegeria sp. R13_0 TaxID=2821099 RepID=UPI001AD98C36|nr:LysR family transcriptional regulator [Ruegeria sp. R13_0]MBO9434935.1 LysR family transcriptional regulator [Ruegeria sp. R13_0]
MSLRFRQLQAFHAIMETGTVTGAASVLGISQPGISNLLSQLEREARLPLFERTKGRLLPTPEAELLYREVDTVVRGLDHVAQAVTDLQNKHPGQLQVAAPHMLSFGFMPREIARFSKSRPNLSVSFQSQYSSKIQEWVTSGLFEIGIVEMPILHDTLNAKVFRFETLATFPENSPLAAHEVLTPELLENEPFIVMGPEHQTHRRTREVFQKAGRDWRTKIHTHLSENLLSFVKQGMGVAMIDPFTVSFDGETGYQTRPFQPPVMLDLAVITAKGRPLSAIGQAFLAQLMTSIETFAKGAVPDERQTSG